MNRKIKAKHGMQALISLLMAFAVSGILMAVCGYQPFLIFGAILHGAFGSKSAIVQTLIQSTPLIFSADLAEDSNLHYRVGDVNYTFSINSQTGTIRALTVEKDFEGHT